MNKQTFITAFPTFLRPYRWQALRDYRRPLKYAAQGANGDKRQKPPSKTATKWEVSRKATNSNKAQRQIEQKNNGFHGPNVLCPYRTTEGYKFVKSVV